jgi:ATP-dependent Clp protease ATP-binding subunit ClpB
MATPHGHQQIDVEHLLAALLEQEGGLAASILGKSGIQTEPLLRRLNAELDRMPKVSGSTGGFFRLFWPVAGPGPSRRVRCGQR